MDRIEKNEVSLLSHIIYTIYNTPQIAQMRLEVLKLLKYAVPFDTANFFLVQAEDETNYTLTDLVNVNSLKNPDIDAVLKKYMTTCFDIDNTHWLCTTKKSIAYRSTDFLSEEALENTEYYKEMFVPYDLHFGAQIVCAHEGVCLGLLTLFRSKDLPNFSDKEIFFLDSLKDHLSVRLYEAHTAGTCAGGTPISWFEDTYSLTHREREILELLFEGLENEKIAEKLCISENTLRRHIYNLYGKLRIQHRWQLHFLTNKTPEKAKAP